MAALRAVAADAERGGALRYRDEARSALRRLGTRLPAPAGRAAAAGSAALSGREREIAELVAAGRMNKQIAAALALSEKTIEANLSRIYAKVGVRSRAELAAQIARERGRRLQSRVAGSDVPRCTAVTAARPLLAAERDLGAPVRAARGRAQRQPHRALRAAATPSRAS